MICRSGDLVLIPFPFSDLKATKKRPVLVLTKPDRHGDFIGLAVTSVPQPDPQVAIDHASLSEGALPQAELGDEPWNRPLQRVSENDL